MAMISLCAICIYQGGKSDSDCRKRCGPHDTVENIGGEATNSQQCCSGY